MQSKVNRACQRCKRLKLKCDARKPCILCSRAGAECVAVSTDIWRTSQPPQSNLKKRKTQQRAKATNIIHDSSVNEDNHGENVAPPFQNVPSSSTASFVEETLQYNDIPNTSNQQAFDNDLSQAESGVGLFPTPILTEIPRTIFRGRSPRLAATHNLKSATKELAAVLPSVEVAKLLIDTYFDRVHWFTLLFHQTEFRRQFMQLYDESGEVSATCDLGHLSTALAVCAVGLQYLGDYRSKILATFGVDRNTTQTSMLEVLGRRLLDIITLESIEAVQTCILLGTFYLFHGQPELAWPICGCGLRIAQALNLHRNYTPDSQISDEAMAQIAKHVEARKRCWWAIYEVETFCCMLYGYPLSILDDDCDVGHLNPHFMDTSDFNTQNNDLNPDNPAVPSVNLLYYKYLMAKLSVQIKTTLSRIYRAHPSILKPQNRTMMTFPPQMQQLDRHVESLNYELDSWFSEYQSVYHTDGVTYTMSQAYTDTDMDNDIGAEGADFNHHLFQLQKLVLRFAFENARILVNRPLLWHKKTKDSTTINPEAHTRLANASNSAMILCREAALQTSRLGNSPSFGQASKTFAVAFMSMHILTAGVTLCMLSNLEPLNQHAHGSKIGVHQLMKMQASLRPHSQQAEPSLEVLKQLLELVVKKELDMLLDLPIDAATRSLASQRGEVGADACRPLNQRQSQSLTLQGESSTHSQLNPQTLDHDRHPVVLQSVANVNQEDMLLSQHTTHPSQLLDVQDSRVTPLDSAPTTQDQAADSLYCFDDDFFLDDLSNQEQGWIWNSDIFNDLHVL